MISTQVHETLDKMLNDPKTKNFLNHLIRSYYPHTKVTYVSEKPSKFYKCVLAKEDLLSCKDIQDEIVKEEFKTNFQKHVKLIGSTSVESPINMTIKDKEMGITGVDTTTNMSVSSFKEFNAWLIAKSAAKDKHILWLLNSIRHKEKEAKIEATKYTTFSLGDLDVFKKIKIKY